MNAPGNRKLQVGHGLFDPLTGDLFLEGRTVRLRPRTAALLAYLVQHDDRAVGKDELMQTLWPNVVVTDDSIVQCVKEIRQALGTSGREWIRTLPRTGYAFAGNHAEAKPAPAWRRIRDWWRWAAAVVLATGLAGSLAWRFLPTSPTPAPVSIVVLPIANATGDSAHDRTAEDLTEAITDKFGRGRFRVIAPSTARTFNDKPVDVRALGAQLKVRYVVQGALLPDEARPVLRLRLADAVSSLQLWQQDFKISPGFPELRPEFVGGILAPLAEQLIRAEASRSGNPDALRAAQLLGRANDVLRGAGSPAERNAQSIALLEEAVRLNDDLGSAWAMLGASYLWDVRFSAARVERLERAAQAVERARSILPTDDAVIAWQAAVYFEQGRAPDALKLSERALELNPGNAMAMFMRARALIGLGRPQEALAQLEQAKRKSPRDPILPGMYAASGVAHLHLGDDSAAVAALQHAVRMMPQDPTMHLFLAAAFGAGGRIDEARTEMAQFQRLRPGFTLSRWRATEVSKWPAYLEQRQRLYEGLRRAGMPE